MIEKWKQKAIHMNFKKAVIIFLITCFVLMISVPVVLYGNFQNRIIAWEQVKGKEMEHREEELSQEEKLFQKEEEFFEVNERDTWNNDEFDSGDREQKRDSKEREEKDLEDIYRFFRPSLGDFTLLACCAAIEMALGIWYWLLGLIAAYRKAYRMGVNGSLAVLGALFFNLAAVAVLYLYGMLKGTCVNCGRVRSGNGKFCDRCGRPLKKECPQCRQEVDVSSAYCSNCGKKLNGDEEAEK